MSNHVFVARGDLLDLACDAVILPCDAEGNISNHWRPAFRPEDIRPGGKPSWFRLDGQPFPGVNTSAKRAVARSATPVVWLVDTASPTDAHGIAEQVSIAVTQVAAHLAEQPDTGRQRARPLIGLPVFGVGEAGHGADRGAVLAAQLAALSSCGVHSDVAIVIRDERDFVAAQHSRSEPTLGHDLDSASERLADAAEGRSLALFIGAGVSVAAGLPSWPDLISELERKAGFPEGALAKVSPLDAAQAAQRKLEDKFDAFMRSRFQLAHPALAHLLLAGLDAECAVTTNYDNGYERAVKAISGKCPAVLPRERVQPGEPWLLKLHGDIAEERSLVLTREQYLELAESGTPLVGMVQALLMTRHLLFVGYSMIDDDFAKLAYQVRRTLGAKVSESQPLGTALLLSDDPVRITLWGTSLGHVSMAGSSVPEQARSMEIFLDRLLWLTTTRRHGPERYALDKRYDGLDDTDGSRAAARELLAAYTALRATAKNSSTGRQVAQLLRSLGHETEAPAADDN